MSLTSIDLNNIKELLQEILNDRLNLLLSPTLDEKFGRLPSMKNFTKARIK